MNDTHILNEILKFANKELGYLTQIDGELSDIEKGRLEAFEEMARINASENARGHTHGDQINENDEMQGQGHHFPLAGFNSIQSFEDLMTNTKKEGFQLLVEMKIQRMKFFETVFNKLGFDKALELSGKYDKHFDFNA